MIFEKSRELETLIDITFLAGGFNSRDEAQAYADRIGIDILKG